MKFLLKLTVGIVLISILLSQIDFEKINQTLSETIISYFLIGVFFFVTASFFEIFRLYFLLKNRCGFYQVARIVYIGIFFNNFLPTSFGGDAYKIYWLKKNNITIDQALTFVFFDRFIGFSILVLFGAIYLLFNITLLSVIINEISLAFPNIPSINLSIILVYVATILVVLFLLKPFLQRMSVYCISKGKEIFSIIKDFSFDRYLFQGLLSILFHLARLFAIYFIILSFSEFIAWHKLIFILSTLAIIASIPISIGGLGLREGTLAGGLILLGVDTNVAVSVALINLLILWIKSIIGALLFTIDKSTTSPTNTIISPRNG